MSAARRDTPAALSVAAGGAAWCASSIAWQALQIPLCVHTGTRHFGVRLLPRLFGVATVSSGSVAALCAADAVAGAGGRDRHHNTASAPAAAVVGILSFLALGGRFWALSPSGLSSLGAFSSIAAGSLPATLAYATPSERAAIQEIGRRIGCHACGMRPLLTSRAPRFIADHQPPLSEVKRTNRALWRRVLAQPVRQRFYPHCESCSLKQAALLREREALIRRLGARRAAGTATAARPAVMHLPSLRRPWHTVGIGLGLMALFTPACFDYADELATVCTALVARQSRRLAVTIAALLPPTPAAQACTTHEAVGTSRASQQQVHPPPAAREHGSVAPDAAHK